MIFRTYRQALLLAVMIVGVGGLAAAQDDQAATRSISVTGHGEAAGPPDQAQVTVGVQTLAATVEQSARDNQTVVARILRALDAQGIDEKDIQTANYSIWPEQQYDPRGGGEPKITGYRVSNTVRVTVNEVDKVGAVLGAVTDAGANSVQGVSFGVRDTAALEERARAAAMANARERAEALAGLAGVTLGEVQTISMSSGGGQPLPMMGVSRMAMAEAAPDPGIAAGQLSVNVQVQVTYAIR